MTTSSAQLIAALFSQTDALTRPVDPAAVDAMKRGADTALRRMLARETREAIWSTIGSAFLIVIVVGTPALMSPVMAYLFGNITPGTIALSAVTTLIAIALVFTFATWRVRSVRNRWRAIGTWTHRWRLAQFAGDNGILYNPRPTTLPNVSSVLAAADPHYLDAFALQIDGRTTLLGNARSRNTDHGGHARAGSFYVAIRIDAQLPHMMLVPRGKRLAARTVPMLSIANTQRLKLEGDFDRYFALYAPVGYERDALYVITPDLMALLIDNLPGSYVETFGDTVVITTPEPLDFERPESWQGVARLIETMLPKTLRQTSNYRDDRSAVRGEIAPEGRSLRAGIPIGMAFSALILVVQVLAIALR